MSDVRNMRQIENDDIDLLSDAELLLWALMPDTDLATGLAIEGVLVESMVRRKIALEQIVQGVA